MVPRSTSACATSIAEADALIAAGKLSPLALITAETIAEGPTTEAPPLKVRNPSVFDRSHQPSNSAPSTARPPLQAAVLVEDGGRGRAEDD